ncbi:MAG: GNAT family N-acetyltransferase, partial [Thaumarchaeota archaeon]|nr:GNAT family N-acetyltransferase [Nitrososphaerota archaeon]
IEESSLSDLDKIYELERECFGRNAYSKSFIRFLLADLSTIALKAVGGHGDIVGSIIGRVEKSSGKVIGRVYTVDVKPEYRRRGIGRMLLERLEAEFRRMGCEKVVLEVAIDNEPAINLYKSMGYRFLTKLKNYYGSGKDAYRAEKPLGEDFLRRRVA